MKIIGLTGGIGSGKSAAAACFREAGIPVIDADGIGHNLLENDLGIRDAVIAAFGKDITDDGRIISREKLAALVFKDAATRQRLNAMLHPAIIAEISQQGAMLYQAGHKAIIIEAALIGESGTRPARSQIQFGNEHWWLTGIILVLASESIRMERLMQYRDFSLEEAQKRIAAQTPPESKTALADWVIDNNGSLDALRAQVMAIVEAIQQ